MVRRSSRVGIGCLSGLLLAAGALAQRPADTDTDRTLRELLNEVRLLRQILQATSVGSVRAQILLTQRQLHNERTLQIERQLASVRSEQAQAQKEFGQMEDRLADFDQELRAETDPEKRATIEDAVRQVTRARDRAKDGQAPLQVRENELVEALSREQADVDRVQRDLDRIEKDLDELQSTSGKKP
jgi:chromosome segregation ATPase